MYIIIPTHKIKIPIFLLFPKNPKRYLFISISALSAAGKLKANFQQGFPLFSTQK